MKNPELYQKTVDILVNAYFNDTLQHNNPCGCAVGNLVAANCGYSFEMNTIGRPVWVEQPPFWSLIHSVGGHSKSFNLSFYRGAAKTQIDATGYSPYGTAKIEIAFEQAPRGNSDDEYMFNGLMAVIEVLDIIHENTDTEITAKSKEKFIKEPMAFAD